MAEDDRTELATGRRLDDLAGKGQFAYSKEVSGALTLFIIAAALSATGSDLVDPLRSMFIRCFSLEDHQQIAVAGVATFLFDTSLRSGLVIAPLLLVAFTVVLVSGFFQIGLRIDTGRLAFRWERLDIAAGFKRILKPGGFVPLSYALAKLIAVGWITWGVAEPLVMNSGGLAQVPLRDLIALLTDAALRMAFRVGTFLLLIAGFDFFFQRWKFSKDTMMTKHEVKEENKQAEGDPVMKGKIKSRQREIARSKMIRNVRKATVVIRNPTHFAVALKYERGVDGAPRVVAKGQDFLALRIIAEAEKHKVPVVSKPEVARELYRTVKVGNVVPETLYKAVAAILAFVLRQKQKRA